MSLQIQIRPAQLADASAITALLERSFPALLATHYNADVLATALPHIAQAQPNLLASGTYFVAEDQNTTLIGAGGWSDFSPTGGTPLGRCGHIRHVVCDPDLTRQGVGRAIMNAAVQSAQMAQIETLHCWSTLNAAPFYQRLGFEPLLEVELSLAPGVFFPARQMIKSLSPPSTDKVAENARHPMV